MPFNLKKTYASNEYCVSWLEFGGNTYNLVVGSGFARVYNQGGTVVYSGATAEAHLFTIAGKMFLILCVNNTNSLNILRWTGAAFNSTAAFANGYASGVWDFRSYGGNYYFVASYGGFSGGFFATDIGSALFKFTGANSGGLSIIKTYTNSTRFITSFDINESNGDFILAEKDFGVGTGNSKIIKRTSLGVETELIFLAGLSKDIHIVRIFDSLIHYIKQGSNFTLAKLDTFSAGAVETVIATGLLGTGVTGNNGKTAKIFDGYLWARLHDRVYRYSTGAPPVLFDTFTGLTGGFSSEFSAITAELILGVKGKFVTTAIVCDLTLGFPSYTKVDETSANADDGIITVNASSSFAIQYSQDGVIWQSSNVFGGLAPGSYDIFIKDSKGCTNEILDITILEFDPVDPPGPVVGTELIIDARPINSHNFITWFNAIGDTAFNSTTITNCVNGYPKPYRLNKPKAKNHYPCIVNGEQFSFYINFDTDYANPLFTSFRLYVINIYGVVQDDVAPLLQVMAADGVSYFIYASVTLAGLNPGAYRLAIVNPNDAGRIIFVSQEIKVITTAIALQETFRVVYKASVNMYRFLYESIPSYVHEIRLRMNVLEENPEGELSQYRASSSGKLRNVYVELDLALKLETYWFDDLAHRAVFTFQVHDYIFLNGKSYLVKSLYKPSWGNPAMWTSKGILEVYEQDFSTANRYGTKDAIVIVGSDDPLLLGDNTSFIKL